MLTQFSYWMERWQSYDEFSAASLLAAFETAAEPSERSVIETQAPLAKSSRINPLTAREPDRHAARRHLGYNSDVFDANTSHSFDQVGQDIVESLCSHVRVGRL
jgi:hypothetical protein